MNVDNLLYRISKEIQESQLLSPLVIGIPKRGDLLAKRISNQLKNLNFKHDLDTVNYRPFRDDLKEKKDFYASIGVAKEALEKTHLNISPQDRDVILIDDVIFTGRTLRASIEAVIYSGRPKSITLACLIDRGHRELPISPKFVGKNIPTSEKQYVSVYLKEIDNEDRVEVTKWYTI